MDLRLVVPALGVWLGAAIAFFVTGLGATPFDRHDRAQATLLIGALVLIAAVASAIAYRRSRLISVAILGVGAFASGLLVAAAHVGYQTSQPLAQWIDGKEKVVIFGEITNEPRVRNTAAGAVWKPAQLNEVTLDSSVISTPEHVLEISVPISLELAVTDVTPPPGSFVQVAGEIGQSFRYGNFAAALTETSQISVIDHPGPINTMAKAMREGLRNSLEGINPRSGSLVAGLAIGDDSTMPTELKEQMRTTGLAHLTAVSGGNVAIVLALVVGLCALAKILLLGRVVISLLALGFYVVLVQPQPSVLRAATMGAIVVVSFLVGGRRAGPSVLAIAVILLIALMPSMAIEWGFVLSVSATAGIVMLYPSLQQKASEHRYFGRFPPILLAAALLTLSAQVATFPVLLAMGSEFSLGSIPANVLAMPMVPFITVGGLFASLVSPISLELGHALALMSSWPASWIAGLASFFSSWPTMTGYQLLASLVIGTAIILLARRLRRKELLLVLPVIVLIPIVNHSFSKWLPENWLLVACDVGQGDAIVLRDPTGAAIVVDVGPTPELIDTCLRELGVSSIEAIVITHFHRDHVGGIAGAIQGREVGGIYSSPYHEPADQYEYAQSVIPPSLNRGSMKSGQVWSLGESQLSVFWPERILTEGSMPNNASIVLTFESQGLTILLPGDIEREAQQAIMRAHSQVNADVVKVPHHGSANLDPGFAAWAGGSVAIYSVGTDNDYGHPSADSLAAWSSAEQFRTDLHGAIAVAPTASGGFEVSTKS